MHTLKGLIESIWKDIQNTFHTQFPDRPAVQRKLRSGLGLLLLFGILYIAGLFFPEGFDWVHQYSQGIYPPFWMPWTKPLIDMLNYPAIFALSILALGLRTYRNKPSRNVMIVAALLIATSPNTLWLFHLGGLDGLALVGMLILPIGAPLVLIKPQVAFFSLLAKRSSLIFAAIWILISFAIWGFWPLTWLEFFTPKWDAEWVQDIALFPWGLIPALALMWFSQGDEDLLMAAGSLASPHLFQYHFIVLMPSLARMRYPWMFLTWVMSFPFLLANWFGDWAWHLGNLLSLCFWFGIYFSMPREKRPKPGLPDWLLFWKRPALGAPEAGRGG